MTRTIQMVATNDVIETDTSLLTEVMNDPDITLVGDPMKSSYGLRIEITSLEGAEDLERVLCQLEVEYRRTRPFRPDGTRSEVTYLGVYNVDDLRRILDHVGDDLADDRREQLDLLVRNRGPVPDRIIERMHTLKESGRSYEQIADILNEKGVIDGMAGKSWTTEKVRRALGK